MPPMKRPHLTIHARWMLLPLALLLCHSGSSAVTFTVTPATIGNTYNGFVTLQMTGLFTNETVQVQKYLDVNANGVVDPADALVQQFQVTDGQGPTVIGVATNINIPYDSNPANG